MRRLSNSMVPALLVAPAALAVATRAAGADTFLKPCPNNLAARFVSCREHGNSRRG